MNKLFQTDIADRLLHSLLTSREVAKLKEASKHV